MKFLSAISIISAMASGASAFVAPSSCRRMSTAALFSSADPYASLLDKITSSSELTSSSSVSATDPYASMLDAISSAADAASTAAATSSELASSLASNANKVNMNLKVDTDGLSSIVTPEAISAAQTKLSVLESNLASSSDPVVTSKAIMDALDASIQAAEHAYEASNAPILVHNLAHFDQALADSMALAPEIHLLPPETAELVQANFAQLIHNLSGMAVDDAFVTNFIADVDRKLDTLAPGASASTILMYGTLAFMLAYSQRQAGVQEYKQELREMLEGGDFDIDVLAKDVGLAKAVAIVQEEAITKELEDPAIAMAAISKEELVMVQKYQEKERIEVEPLSSTPDANVAEKQSSVSGTVVVATAAPDGGPGRNKEAVLAAIPKPPVEDIPMPTLMEAAASEDIQAKSSAANDPVIAEPENVVVLDFATKNVEKVKVVQKKKNSTPVVKKVAASPLARLFAEEIGFDLAKFGKGSGKNGRILIDDVRQYQKAKASMESAGTAYFATVSA